jgi:protein phosphatase
VQTSLSRSVTIREENAMAALETMSRFAADPRWIIYLPPTMSPCETSSRDDVLEYPTEAFSYFADRGVGRVVCEQKHMGSRAVLIVCQDAGAAKRRFGVGDGTSGICYTRTGRRFFDDDLLESACIARVREQLLSSGFFGDFDTDWVCLDCELMPWSAKARSLLKKQYAPTGVAGREGLKNAIAAIESSLVRSSDVCESDPGPSLRVGSGSSLQDLDLDTLLSYYRERERAVSGYIYAYRGYCWPVDGLDGISLAPFHVLATEGAAHTDKDHVWHMETIRKYCVGADGLVIETPYLIVDTTDEESVSHGIAWWEDLTNGGGEGMVVKPPGYIAKGPKGLIQPAVKCRGPEYLRIIYGPEYSLAENLPRLKPRNLGKKRSLALREFSLGVESLERFCAKEPFYRVHECVFGVLALESEPVDPRL